MKKATTYLVGTIVSVLALTALSTVVFAQVDPADAPAGGTFDQRLAQRKAERNLVIEEKDQKRIINLCVGAQADVTTIQAETRQLSTNRATVYRDIDAKLWITTGRLKLRGVDTFKIEKQRAEFNQSVVAFQATLASYQQALDDTVVVNCAADPIGFRVFLDTARIYYARLSKQSEVIRSFAVNDIKPTLAEYTADLQPKSQGDN